MAPPLGASAARPGAGPSAAAAPLPASGSDPLAELPSSLLLRINALLDVCSRLRLAAASRAWRARLAAPEWWEYLAFHDGWGPAAGRPPVRLLTRQGQTGPQGCVELPPFLRRSADPSLEPQQGSVPQPGGSGAALPRVLPVGPLYEDLLALELAAADLSSLDRDDCDGDDCVGPPPPPPGPGLGPPLAPGETPAPRLLFYGTVSLDLSNVELPGWDRWRERGGCGALLLLLVRPAQFPSLRQLRLPAGDVLRGRGFDAIPARRLAGVLRRNPRLRLLAAPLLLRGEDEQAELGGVDAEPAAGGLGGPGGIGRDRGADSRDAEGSEGSGGDESDGEGAGGGGGGGGGPMAADGAGALAGGAATPRSALQLLRDPRFEAPAIQVSAFPPAAAAARPQATSVGGAPAGRELCPAAGGAAGRAWARLWAALAAPRAAGALRWLKLDGCSAMADGGLGGAPDAGLAGAVRAAARLDRLTLARCWGASLPQLATEIQAIAGHKTLARLDLISWSWPRPRDGPPAAAAGLGAGAGAAWPGGAAPWPGAGGGGPAPAAAPPAADDASLVKVLGSTLYLIEESPRMQALSIQHAPHWLGEEGGAKHGMARLCGLLRNAPARLRHLGLGHCGLGTAGLEALRARVIAPAAAAATAGGGSAAAAALSGGGAGPALESLDVRGAFAEAVRVPPAGAAAAAALLAAAGPGLRSIDLGSSAYGHDGGLTLAAGLARHRGGLERLALRHCNLTADAAEALARALAPQAGGDRSSDIDRPRGGLVGSDQTAGAADPAAAGQAYTAEACGGPALLLLDLSGNGAVAADARAREGLAGAARRCAAARGAPAEVLLAADRTAVLRRAPPQQQRDFQSAGPSLNRYVEL